MSMRFVLSVLFLFLGLTTTGLSQETNATAVHWPHTPKEQLLQQVTENANAFLAWRYSAPGAPDKQEALRKREVGILKLEQLFKELEAGSANWAKLKFRRLAFALDDKEVLDIADVPDAYLETIPVEVAFFRKIQVDACLRMGDIERASQIAEKCVRWTSDAALLEQVKAGGFNRGAFLGHIQDIGVIVIVKAPELEGTDKQKLEMVKRVASRNSSPQINAAKSMAEHTIRSQKRTSRQNQPLSMQRFHPVGSGAY